MPPTTSNPVANCLLHPVVATLLHPVVDPLLSQHLVADTRGHCLVVTLGGWLLMARVERVVVAVGGTTIVLWHSSSLGAWPSLFQINMAVIL